MEKKQTHIQFGFIIGILMVVIGLVVYIAGMAFKPGMQYIAYIPFVIGIILNAQAYSKANDGYVTFGNVFGSGFKASMIVTIVLVAWGLAMPFIFPNMKEEALTKAREEMAKNPRMTDEMIDPWIDGMKKYWAVMTISFTILGALFFGAIFSLIAGAIAKKNGERPMTSGDNF